MDVNKVYLSGIVDRLLSGANQTNDRVLTGFYLKTTRNDTVLSPVYDYHQIFLNRENNVEQSLLTRLTVGQKVNVKGSIKNFIYMDPLGHRVTTSKVVASHISIFDENKEEDLCFR
ncbi:MAG: single-stranded DNA-binding protein [Aeromonadales bacterium]|nr:single-stranded DNA-binding protein [Aeromonadales bacterium]